jgi:hypothetical protein
MKKTHIVFLLFVILIFTNDFCFGQKEFSVTEASKIYSAKVTVKKFKNNDCSGPGTVTIYKKSTNKLVQKIQSDNLCFYLENPESGIYELYGDSSPLIFGDFNFDGFEDVAVNNGHNGSYGMPSYDVYLLNTNTRQFVLSPILTDLASSNLGMFRVDKKRKRITIYNKSGCCWHITTEYEVLPDGVDKTYELEEDATNGSDFVTVRERKPENGVWYETEKRVKIEEYYKDN